MTAVRRHRDDKFSERRAELAEAALQTLAELGYARTSVREIAQNSQFSHGVLHYYFTDKVDLILCSVRQYKARFVTGYDEIIRKSTSFSQLLDGFAGALGDTIRTEAPMHRLWYDLRSQSMFEEAFRADVAAIEKNLEAMVWRVMSRLSELAGSPVRASSNVTYAILDGVFQHCLLKHLSGDRKAIASMKASIRLIVMQLLGVDVADSTPARPHRRKLASAAA